MKKSELKKAKASKASEKLRSDHSDLTLVANLFMMAERKAVEDQLQVSVVGLYNKPLHQVPLLVDTGGTISIAGTRCKNLIHFKDIESVDPLPVKTANGIMHLDAKWNCTLDLNGARVQVSLYLAPLYTGGIIFGVDIQEALEISIRTGKGYRSIDYSLLGVQSISNLRTGNSSWTGTPAQPATVVVINNSPLSPYDIRVAISLTLPDSRIDEKKSRKSKPSSMGPELKDPDIPTTPTSVDLKREIPKRRKTDNFPKEKTTEEKTLKEIPMPVIGMTWNKAISGVWMKLTKRFPVLVMAEGQGPQVKTEVRIPIKDPHLPPVCVPNYRSALAEKDFINTKIRDLLGKGIIRQTRSEWNSPILVVPKAGSEEKFRLVIDYRKLNKRVAGDRYPLPHIEDLLAKPAHAKIYSKIDLTAGFHQIPVNRDDQDVLAFSALTDTYTYCYVPFGLNIAPALFTRVLNEALKTCEAFTAIYVDDILVFSETIEQHLEHLTQVLTQLGEANFRVSIKKSTLGVLLVEYLGHILTPGQIQQNPRKIAAISEFPEPASVRQVRKFVGMCGYYRRFIKGFAKIAAPLTDLTSGKGKVTLNQSQVVAFKTLQKAMAEAPLLELYCSDRETRVEVDSCSTGTGAVLTQNILKQWKPVAYFSKKFSKEALSYPSREAEAYGIYLAILHWRVWLLGRRFTVVSDHESLTLASHGRNSRRIQRYLLGLSEFEYKIIYRRGIEHTVPDALAVLGLKKKKFQKSTCCPLTTSPDEGDDLGINQDSDDENEGEFPTPPNLLPIEETLTSIPGKEEWAKATLRCPELAPIARKLDGHIFDSVTIRIHAEKLIVKYQLTLKQGIIVDNKGLKWVPEEYRDLICSLFHRAPFSNHHDAKRTVALLTRVVTWPHVEEHVRAHIAQCISCQLVKGKVQKPPQMVRNILPIPFDMVGIDYAGPFPKTRSGKRYLLVCIDIFSGWPEAVALTRNDAASTAKALFFMFSRTGFPRIILSDNGSHFRNSLMTKLWKLCGTTHQQFSTTHHPQSNGAAENLVKSIKRAFLLDGLDEGLEIANTQWDQKLDLILLALRKAPRGPLWLSPAQVIYGKTIEGPIERKLTEDQEVRYTPVEDWIFSRIQTYHETRKMLGDALQEERLHLSEKRQGKTLKTLKYGDFVLVHHQSLVTDLRPGVRFRWRGPYIVYKATSEVTYIVLIEGSPKLCSVSRLLPYDPTGLPVASPLKPRLLQLRKELEAYEAWVAAEAKSLSRHHKSKRLIPTPLEDVADPPISVDQNPENLELDDGAHPVTSELTETTVESPTPPPYEPEDKVELATPPSSRRVSSGTEPDASRDPPQYEGKHDNKEEVTIDPESYPSLPHRNLAGTENGEIEPSASKSLSGAAIQDSEGMTEADVLPDLRGPDKTLHTSYLPKNQKRKVGVIQWKEKFFLAEHAPGDVLYPYSKKVQTGKIFFKIHENKYHGWRDPKTTEPQEKLWPVIVSLADVQKVIIPFHFSITRERMEERLEAEVSRLGIHLS